MLTMSKAFATILFVCLNVAVLLADAQDMRAEFAKYQSCSGCIAAGWGWYYIYFVCFIIFTTRFRCTIQKRCGGFANKNCPAGDDFGAGYKKKKKKRKKKKKKKAVESGNDMASTFAKFKSCSSCTAAGWGWYCTTTLVCIGLILCSHPGAPFKRGAVVLPTRSALLGTTSLRITSRPSPRRHPKEGATI